MKKNIFVLLFVFFSILTICSCSTAPVKPDQAPQNNSPLVGSPLVIIPTIAEENRIKLSFSSNINLETTDSRSDKRSLGNTALRLSSEPLFSIRFALEKTLRSLGYKIAPGGSITLSADIIRLELILPKNSQEIDATQAYVKINFLLKDSFGSALLMREYEGSSTSNGSPEQKLGVAINDILSQVSIDKELQTVMASY